MRWPGLHKKLRQEGLDAHSYLMPGCCMLEDLWRWRMHRCAERDTPCGQRTRKLVASVHWWIPHATSITLSIADSMPHFDPQAPGPTSRCQHRFEHEGQRRPPRSPSQPNSGPQVRAGLARSLCDRVYHVCLLDEKPRKILGELSKR